MRALALMFLLGAVALSGCDQQRIAKLEEGVATEADVRQQFGDPVMIVERADGSKQLEYPRQPEGTANYLIVIGADGKMTSLRQLLTPDNFAKVQPGMSQDAVRKLLGKPARMHSYAMKPDETIWEWRFLDPNPSQTRKLFSVTFDRDRQVLSTATAEDAERSTSGK